MMQKSKEKFQVGSIREGGGLFHFMCQLIIKNVLGSRLIVYYVISFGLSGKP